jgi:hypothetical protein
MSPRVWRCTLLVVASLGFHSSLAHGQWSISAQVGSDRFWGGSVETGPEHRSFRPYRPTTLGAGIRWDKGWWDVGLHLGYSEAGLALEGAEALIAAKGVFTVYSAAPELGIRVTSTGSGQQLWFRAGPLVELWSIIAEESRGRAGAQGAISLLVPLSRRFSASLTAGAAVISSPFEHDELEGYELRALWRRRFAVSLEYGL